MIDAGQGEIITAVTCRWLRQPSRKNKQSSSTVYTEAGEHYIKGVYVPYGRFIQILTNPGLNPQPFLLILSSTGILKMAICNV